jgi:hypothetical protein
MQIPHVFERGKTLEMPIKKESEAWKKRKKKERKQEKRKKK